MPNNLLLAKERWATRHSLFDIDNGFQTRDACDLALETLLGHLGLEKWTTLVRKPTLLANRLKKSQNFVGVGWGTICRCEIH